MNVNAGDENVNDADGDTDAGGGGDRLPLGLGGDGGATARLRARLSSLLGGGRPERRHPSGSEDDASDDTGETEHGDATRPGPGGVTMAEGDLVELPMDWDKLKAEALRRDDGRCVLCDAGPDRRQLYVLYARRPGVPTRAWSGTATAASVPEAGGGGESGHGSTENGHPASGRGGGPGSRTADGRDSVEIEVPGHDLGNMVTVCEMHSVGGRKDPRTVVVGEEARAARAADVEVSSAPGHGHGHGHGHNHGGATAERPPAGSGVGTGDSAVGDAGRAAGNGDGEPDPRDEYGFEVDFDPEFADGTGEGVPPSGADRPDGPGGDANAEFGMAEEFAAAGESATERRATETADARDGDGMHAGGDATAGATRSNGSGRDGPNGGGRDGSNGGDGTSSTNRDGLTRTWRQRPFGKHLPFVGRAARALRAAAWVAVSLSVTIGAVVAVLNADAGAGAAAALGTARAAWALAVGVLTAPLALVGLFAVGYGLHLRYRDAPFSAWPTIRSSPRPTVAGRRLLIAAVALTVAAVLTVASSTAVVMRGAVAAVSGGGTDIIGIEATAAVSGIAGASAGADIPGGADAGAGAVPSVPSATAWVLIAAFVVLTAVAVKVAGDAVVADRKAGAAMRAWAWEFPIRVGGVVGTLVVLGAALAPRALAGASLTLFGPLALVVLALPFVAPVAALGYVLRRRAHPSTRGVSVPLSETSAPRAD